MYWNYTGPGTGTLEATTTTDATGKFSTGFYVLDVLSPTGAYTVAGVGQTSGTVATATFTLFPQLYVRAQAGGPEAPGAQEARAARGRQNVVADARGQRPAVS